jgi:hypothetical protein
LVVVIPAEVPTKEDEGDPTAFIAAHTASAAAQWVRSASTIASAAAVASRSRDAAAAAPEPEGKNAAVPGEGDEGGETDPTIRIRDMEGDREPRAPPGDDGEARDVVPTLPGDESGGSIRE